MAGTQKTAEKQKEQCPVSFHFSFPSFFLAFCSIIFVITTYNSMIFHQTSNHICYIHAYLRAVIS